MAPRNFSEAGGQGAAGGEGGSFEGDTNGAPSASGFGAPGGAAGFDGQLPMVAPGMGGRRDGAAQPMSNWGGGNGFGFAQGGAIPTEEDATEMGGSMGRVDLTGALATVQSVLGFGRKLHGLGGDEQQEGGAIQEASGYGNGRMPAVPGNQSESGVKPVQPMPGPLPPTNNPFGKRAEAEPEEGGAIDTEEEVA